MAIDKLKIYRDVNKCSTVDELIDVIEKNTPLIEREKNPLWASEQIDAIRAAYDDEMPFIEVTAVYGIRQQLMHIMYYEGRIHLL